MHVVGDMCTSFHSASNELCNALASFAKRLCISEIDHNHLKAYVACHLIPLDKRPGVRPIGVCEVVRRIVSKAILSIIGRDIQMAAGSIQLCAGQPAGIDAAIHAMVRIFDDDDTQALLLVDASNAFNNLNRKTALHNIGIVCPSLATVLRNTYRDNADLFVGGEVSGFTRRNNTR